MKLDARLLFVLFLFFCFCSGLRELDIIFFDDSEGGLAGDGEPQREGLL